MVNFSKNDTGSEKSLQCLGVNLKCESVNTDMDMLAISLLLCIFCMVSFFLSHHIFSFFSIWHCLIFKKCILVFSSKSETTDMCSFSEYCQLVAALKIFKCTIKFTFSYGHKLFHILFLQTRVFSRLTHSPQRLLICEYVVFTLFPFQPFAWPWTQHRASFSPLHHFLFAMFSSVLIFSFPEVPLLNTKNQNQGLCQLSKSSTTELWCFSSSEYSLNEAGQ